MDKMTVGQLRDTFKRGHDTVNSGIFYVRSIYDHVGKFIIPMDNIMNSYAGVRSLHVERLYMEEVVETSKNAITIRLVAEVDLPPAAVQTMAQPLEDTEVN